MVRDHSTKHEPKHEPADIQAGQETAPATPVAASKKRRKGIQAETPSKALGRDTGVQLQLDDILAAEVIRHHDTDPPHEMHVMHASFMAWREQPRQSCRSRQTHCWGGGCAHLLSMQRKPTLLLLS